MSPQISEETLLLLMSIYGGLVLVLCYDVIRIIRRVFKASVLRVVIEDVVFWTGAAIFMFHIFLKYNYGRPRYFAVGAALGTMVLFEWLIGRHIVDRTAFLLRKIMNTLLKPLKKVWKMIKLKTNKVYKALRKKVRKCPNKEKESRPPGKEKSQRRKEKEDRHKRKEDRHRPPRRQDG